MHSSETNPDDAESVVLSEEQLATPPIYLSAKSAEENEAEQVIPAPMSSSLIVPPEEQLTAPSTRLSAEENKAQQATPVSYRLG